LLPATPHFFQQAHIVIDGRLHVWMQVASGAWATAIAGLQAACSMGPSRCQFPALNRAEIVRNPDEASKIWAGPLPA
jgi:hypothetical protein